MDDLTFRSHITSIINKIYHAKTEAYRLATNDTTKKRKYKFRKQKPWWSIKLIELNNKYQIWLNKYELDKTNQLYRQIKNRLFTEFTREICQRIIR